MAFVLLLADDSATMHKVVHITLAREQTQIISVMSGDEALMQAQAHPPDIAVVDLNMPHMDGYAVCRALKDDPNTAHVPVLLLSSSQEPLDSQRAAECGADGHIIKPFELQSFIDKLKQTLTQAANTGATETAALPTRSAPITMTAPLAPASSERLVAHATPPAARAASTPPATAAAARTTSVDLATPTRPATSMAYYAPKANSVASMASVEMAPSQQLGGKAGQMTTTQPDMPQQASGATRDGAQSSTAQPYASGRPDASSAARATQSIPPSAAGSGASGSATGNTYPQRAAQSLPTTAGAAQVAAGALQNAGRAPSELGATARPNTAGAGHGLSTEQLMAMAKDILERVAWEVIPPLAEVMVKEHIERLAKL